MIFGAPFILMPGAAFAEPTDADAIAYISAVETADGEALEPAVQSAIDALVIGLKADGNWTPVSTMALLTGPRSLAGVVVPLRGPTLTSVNFVAGDISRTLGLNGNGTSKYLDTNFSASALGQNNISMGAYVTGTITDGAARFVCANINHMSVLCNAAANGARARVTSSTISTLGSGTTTPALLGVSRASSASFNWRAFGQSGSVTLESASAARHSVTAFVGRSDGGAIVSGTYLASGTRLTAVWAGAAVDLAAMETRMADYHAAIGAAL